MAYLREYRKGDEEAVLDIIGRTLGEYGLSTDTSTVDADVVDIERSYMQAGGTFKILLDGERPIGSYGLYKVSEDTCELRKMYLEPSYKGRGLGRLLMEDSLDTAREMGFKRMVLETNSVLNEAIAMYRKFGFEECEPDHLSNRCDTAMEKML